MIYRGFGVCSEYGVGSKSVFLAHMCELSTYGNIAVCALWN